MFFPEAMILRGKVTHHGKFVGCCPTMIDPSPQLCLGKKLKVLEQAQIETSGVGIV